MPPALPPFKQECFFIAPIGGIDSLDRARSDAVLRHIVRPAAEEVGLQVVRADQISEPGHITLQVVEHCAKARVAVCDLTNFNPNVFYELGLRHARELPTVLISESEHLPFDIAQLRTIFFDHQSLDSAASCREELVAHLKHAVAPSGQGSDSPVAYVEALGALRRGSSQDRSIAAMLVGMDRLIVKVDRMTEAVDDLTRSVQVDTVEYEGFQVEGYEGQVLAWTAMALAMLGPEMRAVLMSRLGFDIGRPRSAPEVAREFEVTAAEVDEMLRSAFSVWTAESYRQTISGQLYTEYEDILRLLTSWRVEDAS